MNKHLFLFFLFLSLLFWNPLAAQYELEGLVTDQYDEPLAFVNILINNNATDGVTTGIDGRFFIERNEVIESLSFSYIGYQPLQLDLSSKESETINVVLEVATMGIAEVVVMAGENPAHRIIRKVVANRDLHNPEKQKGYRCNTYNKVVFDWQPNHERIAQLSVDSVAPKERKGLLGKYQRKRYSRVDELTEQREQHCIF